MQGVNMHLFEDALFHVRSGRHSFFAHALTSGHRFLRVDPGCLRPINRAAERALTFLDDVLSRAHPTEIVWGAGDVVVLDNWSILHARGPAHQIDARTLTRTLIRERAHGSV